MRKPPIKAMEAVKRYCKKNKTCDVCPLHTFSEYGYRSCSERPEKWKIEKEVEHLKDRGY